MHAVSQQEPGLDNTRAALLHSCIWLLIWTTGLGLVLIPLIAPEVPLVIYALGFTPFYLLYICSLSLLKRGRASLAAWTLVMGMLVLQIVANFLNPGLAEQALPSFVNLILIAGFCLHSRAAIITTLIAATSVTTYLVLMVNQLLPEPIYPPSMVVKIPAISITVLTTGGIVTLALRHMTHALNRERESKKDALLSSKSLAKALGDNALRARLSGHLFNQSTLQEESGPSKQRQILRTVHSGRRH